MTETDALGLSAGQLAQVLHAQAHAFLVARPDLAPADAIRKVASLAVLIYDQALLEKALRDAAEAEGVEATLASIVAPPGGATLAVSRGVPVDD